MRCGLLAVLLLAGCSPELTPQEKAAQDERAVAMVEQAQDDAAPPFKLLKPERIVRADIEQHGLYGSSCAFDKPRGSAGPLFLALANTAWIKLEGRLVRLAADKGSGELPLGIWTRYEGKELAAELTLAEEGARSGEELTDHAARLVIRDAYRRVVYAAQSAAECGA